MKVKILVVDDEVSVSDMLVRFLNYEGYDATGCNDPVQALELVKNENFMICILDIQMPGMDGMELLKQIKSLNGMTGVIMMTARASTENVLTCLRRGAETCFLKPLNNLDEIKSAVDGLIARFDGWQEVLKRLKKSEGLEAKSGGA